VSGRPNPGVVQHPGGVPPAGPSAFVLDNCYTGAATDLSDLCLPSTVYAALVHEHWDWFLAIIFFLPEVPAAALGGVFAACCSGSPAGL
jgi:hypothetical protein